MITRRNFIKTTTMATVSAVLLPKMLHASPGKKNIGLQLYTVRDQIVKDLPGTLKEIARIGYTWLEVAGYSDGKLYGMEPSGFKSIVNDLGMEMVSSHVAFSAEQSRQVIDTHLELGIPYVVYPWIDMPDLPSADDYSRAAELFNQLGDTCKQAGLKFGYHNHDFEFKKIGDTTGYDLLLRLTDPSSVVFETDIYWMTFANVDPLYYFQKYPGRFELWHVKDMENSPERGFTEVGEGTIPYGRYFDETLDISGVKYFFIEQDTCKMDPMESIAVSYQNMIKLL